MVGCFLYAKLIRDIICLVGGGALIYSIVRWRHFVFFPIMWPFATVAKVYYFDGTLHKEFSARPWAGKFGSGLGWTLTIIILLAALVLITYGAVWPILKGLYHHYMVC